MEDLINIIVESYVFAMEKYKTDKFGSSQGRSFCRPATSLALTLRIKLKHLSEDDLRFVLSFYQSEVGKKELTSANSVAINILLTQHTPALTLDSNLGSGPRSNADLSLYSDFDRLLDEIKPEHRSLAAVMSHILLDVYRSNMSASEINEILIFYSSSVGRRYSDIIKSL